MKISGSEYLTIEGKPKDNAKIKKGNLLANASYWMSSTEKKLMWWIIWGYQQKKSKSLTLTLDPFHKWAHMEKNNNRYEDTLDAARRLRSREIAIDLPDQDETGYCGFLSYVEHGGKWSGEIQVEITTQISPYIESYVEESKFGFTKYEMSVVGALRTFKAHRMYELAKSINFGNRSKQGVRFSFEDLRLRFGCLTYSKKGVVVRDEYKEWKRFKSKVLDTAILEVGEVAGLTIRYVLERSGRSVSGVRLFVVQGLVEEIDNHKDPRDLYLALEMAKLVVRKKEASALLVIYSDGDRLVLELALEETRRQMKLKAVGNPAGLFVKLVKVDLRKQKEDRETTLIDKADAERDKKLRSRKNVIEGRKYEGRSKTMKELMKKRA
ncbi:MAG: replication initiation protein [Pseudomonadota bacterium]